MRMRGSREWQLVVIGIGTAAVQLDTAVNVAFPAITRGFALAIDDIRWVVISYVLTYASLLLACGRGGDRFGHALVFRIGLGVTMVAQMLCAMADAFEWLLAARLLQGVGAALVLSVGPALTTGLFDEARRTRVLGSYAMMIGVAATSGPWIGGLLVAVWDWPAVFWFRVPVALLALALFRSQGGAVPAPARPLLAAGLFRHRGLVALNLASVLVNLAAFTVWLLVPYFLAGVAGIGVAESGAILSTGAIGAILASLVSGRLIGRVAADRVAAFGAGLVAVGLFLVGHWEADSGRAELVFALTIQGIGLGLFQLAYTDSVTATLPRADRGVAGGLTVMTRTIGTVGAAAALMPILGHVEAAHGFLPAFSSLFLGMAWLPLAMALLIAWRGRR